MINEIISEYYLVAEKKVAESTFGQALAALKFLYGTTLRRKWVLDEWRWDSRKEQRQLTDAQYSAKLAEWIAGHERMVTPFSW